jgi:hypothetical protein
MSKLPFVVEPRLAPRIERIGSEDSGIIEIERRGYLTSGEKNFVQQIAQQDTGTMRLIELARLISREYDLDLELAYDLLIASITNQVREGVRETEIIGNITKDYSTQVQDVIKEIAISKSREELVMAACLITHRVNRDFETADIMEVHPDIISALAELYREEEMKSITRLLGNSEDAADKKADEAVNIEKIEKKRKVTRAN